MSEVTICVFEVFYMNVDSGVVDSATYRAEDEAHAVEIFRRFHTDAIESVEYRGEA